jgi:D-glycero-D-manno-heptose 1,7-bisphosphate phosphatase
MISSQTVFLDRDGVINHKRAENDYVKSCPEFEFLPEVKEARKLLKENGVSVIVTTNQRCVCRGLITEADLQCIHEQMQAELGKAGISIDAIYYCPHEQGCCNCRKPPIGMFLQAKKDFPDIDFTTSTVIGDSLSDMEAGTRLDCRTILAADNHTQLSITEQARTKGITIHAATHSLFEAVDYVFHPLPETD